MNIYSKNDYIRNDLIDSSLKTIRSNITAHGHNFFELEFIIDGTGTYEIDGTKYAIRKNALFLMTPANIHSIRTENVTLINVMFSNPYPQTPLPDIPCIYFDEADGNFLYAVLMELMRTHTQEPTYALLLLDCVLNKLFLHHREPIKSPSSYIQQAVAYMLANFQTGVSAHQVATRLGLSDAYFSDYFHKQMGVSFKAYLDDLRFSYAQKLLTLTALSIKEVQYRSGFLDYANFARRFKEKQGLSPTEYRKKHRVS